MEELKEEMLEYREYIELLENDLKEVDLRLESHNYYKEKLEELYRTNNRIVLKNNLKETMDIIIIIFTFYISSIIDNKVSNLNKHEIISLKLIICNLLNLFSKILPFISLLDFSSELVASYKPLTEYKRLIKDTKKNLLELNNSISVLNKTKTEILDLLKIYNQVANCIEIQLNILNDKSINYNVVYKLEDDEVKVLKFDKSNLL